MRGADETRYVHRGVAVDEAFPATGPPGAESERPPRVCVCNESLSISLSPVSRASPASERASERGLASALVCVHSSAWPRPLPLSRRSRASPPLSLERPKLRAFPTHEAPLESLELWAHARVCEV
jgi:hypothetical protein